MNDLSMQRSDVRIQKQDLISFTAKVLTKSGLRTHDAETVAKVLVWANCRGVDSHGVSRLSGYVEEIKAGTFNARGRARIQQSRLLRWLVTRRPAQPA